jgi:hypothetical protein
LYFFFRDYEVAINCKGEYAKYDGKYDNLLYYYVYNYWLIQKIYTVGDKSNTDFGRINNYIHGVPEQVNVAPSIEKKQE